MAAEGGDARPLVVVFSDGLDNRSWLTSRAVLTAAGRHEAVVYCVQVLPRGVSRQGGLLEAPSGQLVPRDTSAWSAEAGHGLRVPAGRGGFLRSIADETGGRVFRVDHDRDLVSQFRRVLSEFRRRYVLSYVPEGVSATGWHDIEVRVKRRGAVVRARRGYQRD